MYVWRLTPVWKHLNFIVYVLYLAAQSIFMYSIIK